MIHITPSPAIFYVVALKGELIFSGKRHTYPYLIGEVSEKIL
jgi:hypothetical protein